MPVVCFLLKKIYKLMLSVAVRSFHGVSGDHRAPHGRDEIST